ncbi:hypothetical protein D9M68_479860 [compost metagenome]
MPSARPASVTPRVARKPMYSVCAARLAACTAAWEIGAFGSCAASARLALARVPSAMLLLPLA